MKTCLNGTWKLGICEDFRLTEKKKITSLKDVKDMQMQIIDAQVPGNFEIDMERAGLLPDLFYGMNPLKAQEMEMLHLFYSKKFRLDVEDCKKNLNLVFEGIDTVSDIYVNGFFVGHTDNMFIEHVLPLEYLYEGENELFVHISPVALEARRHEGEMYTHAKKYGCDRFLVRKSAYMWGWDIFPRMLTGGIWKDVFIEERKGTEILQAYLFVENLSPDYKVADLKWFYDVRLQREAYADLEIELSGHCRDSNFHVRQRLWSRTGHLQFQVTDPYIWWPRGKGDQHLYEVEMRLYHKREVVDTKTFKTGIRTAQLDRSSVTDENGTGKFCFLVNHKKLFILGTNWVPLDSLPSRGKKRIADALALVEDIGCNMIRCWGGGYYEYDEFYEICDEKGILVWQDFMMGGGQYPQGDWFLEKIYTEAVSVIKRLRQHPCLVLWSGDNECDEIAKFTHYPNYNPNHNKITRHVIRDALRRHDYVRPYLPSSPYIDEEACEKGVRYLTEDHLWGPRDYFKSDFYTKSLAHFASETGYHGCPEPDSIKRFISEAALWPYNGNSEWLLHASTVEPEEGAPDSYRIPLMANQIQVLFGSIPDHLSEFCIQSQISQAEALKFFIERFRMGKWRRTGIIWWNLIDGCPQFSDAVVDYYFTKKLAYGYVKQSQQPVCLMCSEPEDESIAIMGINDSNTNVQLTYQIRDILSESLILEGNTEIPGDSAVTITRFSLQQIDKENGGFLLIEWQIAEKWFKNHYVTWSVPYDYSKYVQGAKKAGLLTARET